MTSQSPRTVTVEPATTMPLGWTGQAKQVGRNGLAETGWTKRVWAQRVGHNGSAETVRAIRPKRRGQAESLPALWRAFKLARLELARAPRRPSSWDSSRLEPARGGSSRLEARAIEARAARAGPLGQVGFSRASKRARPPSPRNPEASCGNFVIDMYVCGGGD